MHFLMIGYLITSTLHGFQSLQESIGGATYLFWACFSNLGPYTNGMDTFSDECVQPQGFGYSEWACIRHVFAMFEPHTNGMGSFSDERVRP